MKLMLKNKVLMTIHAIVKEGIKRGGIPRELHFEPKEATEFLQEYSYLKDEERKEDFKVTPTKSIIIEQAPGHISVVAFHLNGKLDVEKIKEIISEWYKGDINISYIYNENGATTHIPLKVKGKKKPAKQVTISGKLPPPGKKPEPNKEWG